MNNRYYNYPHKELWNEVAWSDRLSPVVPIAAEVGQKNLEEHRIPGKPESGQRTEGIFDPKSNALTWPEKVEYWEKKGLHYHCTSMGLSWVTMVPAEHLAWKGYHDDIDTVLVLPNADCTDPNWCMYLLDEYEDYLEAAAREKFILIFVTTDRPGMTGEYISILQEAVVIFHYNYDRIFLDVSPLGDARAKEIAGKSGMALKSVGGIRTLDISGKWMNRDSLIHKLITGGGAGNAAYDMDRLINSGVGKDLAKAMYLEYRFDDAEDPALIKYWNDMGLYCAFHEKEGEQWVAFLPQAAMSNENRCSTDGQKEDTGAVWKEKLPCVCILQEVNRFDPHQAVTGFAYFHRYHEIAAQGECMLLYFVLEALDDNDLLSEVLKDAAGIYPLDTTRIYITGHSHDGRFSAEYMRRHPDEIAACATLGNEPGQLSEKVTSGFFVVTDEQIEWQAGLDIPLINVSGHVERNSMFPVNVDAPDVKPGQWVAVNTQDKRIDSWQRRLRSANCHVRSREEIIGAADSADTVERKLGFPADKTEILTIDGSENYIADLKNNDGKYHLRIVALGNMPHTVTPIMCDLSWSYMRRFAKDPETGKCLELF